jgi:hypothetical protein
LKRKIREASEILIRNQQTDERVFITVAVELSDRNHTVDRSQKKRHYTEMPAIIEQWQKLRVQPTERPDTEDDMKKQESSGSSSADSQGYLCSIGKEKRADSDKQRQIKSDSRDQHSIVDAFLPIPGNCLILMAHGVAPEGCGRATACRARLAAGHE